MNFRPKRKGRKVMKVDCGVCTLFKLLPIKNELYLIAIIVMIGIGLSFIMKERGHAARTKTTTQPPRTEAEGENQLHKQDHRTDI